MNNKKTFFVYIILLVMLAPQSSVNAHDTTHIHPLITDKIADLIDKSDKTDNAYKEIYEPDPNKEPVIGMDQRLYWGTDFDAGKTLTQDWLLKDQQQLYKSYKTAVDGVVQEDVPGGKVKHHFYHATTGKGLDVNFQLMSDGKPSAIIAMGFFNEAIERMGGYTEEAKHTAFFEFGHALHHVEDITTPAHIHNDAENALFAPIRRYGQLKNTHVVNSTLRFLNCPCLVLKQTGSFSGVIV